MLFPVRAGDGVSAQQRLAVHFQADHGEVAIGKTQGRVARGGEGEQAVGPVVYGEDSLFEECAHEKIDRMG